MTKFRRADWPKSSDAAPLQCWKDFYYTWLGYPLTPNFWRWLDLGKIFLIWSDPSDIFISRTLQSKSEQLSKGQWIQNKLRMGPNWKYLQWLSHIFGVPIYCLLFRSKFNSAYLVLANCLLVWSYCWIMLSLDHESL